MGKYPLLFEPESGHKDYVSVTTLRLETKSVTDMPFPIFTKADRTYRCIIVVPSAGTPPKNPAPMYFSPYLEPNNIRYEAKVDVI